MIAFHLLTFATVWDRITKERCAFFYYDKSFVKSYNKRQENSNHTGCCKYAVKRISFDPAQSVLSEFYQVHPNNVTSSSIVAECLCLDDSCI